MTSKKLVFVLSLLIAGCSSIYLNTLEKIGIPKRQVMIHRVEKMRDTQEEAKQQFKSALAQFQTLTHYSGGDLEDTYQRLNDAYQKSLDKANEIHKRIEDIEDVSDALFAEWEDEIDQYSNASLKRRSQQKLTATKRQYLQLITAMKKAEAKMQPVLAVFKDQVLYLKHNLNAQAIASLKEDLADIESDVSKLILAMEKSIAEANQFIQAMEKN
ncbi:DUF2959 domain-containing protein [methane-oxidizing endosymbiont of Gigantopelta aegis]|uniref:DUF2959 domain-containing protein n=1 Tax=methane-oxidizing endosymbiont of Gigantopelta aegis TaxID=2794938 RepID=UPI0018DB51A3|nr:DUF2959 domain-containing protein [methane-oxidizing endosymbiont of Gigantopelta aegis]